MTLLTRYKVLPILLFIPTILLYLFKFHHLNKTVHLNQSVFKYPSNVKYSYQWSAEASNRYEDDSYNDIISKIDQKYCKQDRCKFILPVTIAEQESKAQFHFRNLAFLSGKLNRTIVLPNVFNSNLGACLKNTFDYYYDENWLIENKHHFNYITMEQFNAWLTERSSVGLIPTAQEIFVQGSKKSRILSRRKNCFYDLFDFSNRPSVNYQFIDSHSQDMEKTTNIIQTLLSDQARNYEYYYRNPPPLDVIHLYYDRRYKIINHRNLNKPINYNPYWVDVSNKISNQLAPFVAIHWRMESLEPLSNLLLCAKNLIQKIKEIPSKNIFLLTDYPHLLNSIPESNSFRYDQLKSEHHEAIQYLYEHLNVTLTSIHDGNLPAVKNWNLIPINTTFKQNQFPDKSVLGIIDKMIAINSQWFFAGKPKVCAKSSSFTLLISNTRSSSIKNGNQNDISFPIKYFYATDDSV